MRSDEETRSAPELVALANGAIVERDVLGVVAEIERKWPGQFRVQYLDPDSSFGATEAPYQIVEHSQKDGRDYVVLQVWELTTETIHKLEAMDTNYVDVQGIIDRTNAKVRRDQLKVHQERMDDAHEKAAAVIKTNKDTYKLTDGDRKITFRTNGEHDVRRD